MKKCKEDWISKQCDIIVAGLIKADSKYAYDMHGESDYWQQQQEANIIEDKSGYTYVPSTEESAILE